VANCSLDPDAVWGYDWGPSMDGCIKWVVFKLRESRFPQILSTLAAAKKMSDGTGVIICLERSANNLHMVQLMLLPPHHLLLQ